MNSIKKAFTIAEMMVIMLIIGFIIVLEIKILNEKVNDYGAPYRNAYTFLNKTAYNILADMYCPDPSSTDPECQTGPRRFPRNSEALCNRMTEYLNIAGEANCKATEINDNADNIFIHNSDAQTLRFITSNSYRFYMSGLKTHAVGRNSIDYFVIYVDLNGVKNPNRITCNKTEVLPDIVPFALTTRGEVIPMGYPAYQKTYVTAQIKFPDQYDPINDRMLENISSNSMSLFHAAKGAWPNAANDDVEEHIDMPFSMMIADDAIYKNSRINQCYSGKGEAVNLPNKDRLKRGAPRNTKTRGCQGGSFDCRVKIDAYESQRL